MGKNAKRRKEAKLQEKLKRSAPSNGCCDHEGHCHHHHHDAAPGHGREAKSVVALPNELGSFN